MSANRTPHDVHLSIASINPETTILTILNHGTQIIPLAKLHTVLKESLHHRPNESTFILITPHTQLTNVPTDPSRSRIICSFFWGPNYCHSPATHHIPLALQVGELLADVIENCPVLLQTNFNVAPIIVALSRAGCTIHYF